MSPFRVSYWWCCVFCSFILATCGCGLAEILHETKAFLFRRSPLVSWLGANPSQELWGCINARNPSRAPAPAATSLSPRRHKPSCPHQCACCGCHDLCQRLLGARLRRWIRADFLSLVRPSVSHPRMLCSLLLFLPSRPQLPAAGPCRGGGGRVARGNVLGSCRDVG